MLRKASACVHQYSVSISARRIIYNVLSFSLSLHELYISCVHILTSTQYTPSDEAVLFLFGAVLNDDDDDDIVIAIQ